MRTFAVLAACTATLAAAAAWAQGPALPPPTRGELLYATHCIACHTTQIHWRNAQKARDWTTLRGEVRRWQAEAKLQWSDDEIDAVTQHLNETIYHFPRAQARQ